MNNGDGISICHREFLGNVSCTGSTFPTPFQNTSYTINPGDSNTFPWLSQIARYFEEYQMAGLVFEYRPSSGMVTSTSPALGVVIAATDYNASNPQFASKQQMDSYEFANSCVPYDKMLHMVECRPRSFITNKLFVRQVDSVVTDRLLYDLGTFQIATQGMPVAYTCGELWVTYHVKLSRPRISTIGQNQMSIGWATPLNSATQDAGLGGTSGFADMTSSTLGFQPVPGVFFAGNRVVLSKLGKYAIIISAKTSSGAGPTNTVNVTLGSNINANVDALWSTGNPIKFETYNAASKDGMMYWNYEVMAEGIDSSNWVTFTGWTSLSSANVTVQVTKYSEY